METVKPYTLFVLKENPYFKKGVLLQLRTAPDLHGYFLPDTGNGSSGFLEDEQVFVCPDFSENIPPANCPVKITQCYTKDLAERITTLDNSAISVFKSIHFQQIRINLPEAFHTIKLLTFTDRLKGFDHYELTNPNLENADHHKFLNVEISHIPPGFYQLILTNEQDEKLVLDCIKFYPDSYNQSYEEFLDLSLRGKVREEADIRIRSTIIKETKSTTVPDVSMESVPEFSAVLLNKSLTLLTEWGENFRKPINDRLLKDYPNLTEQEIEVLTNYGRKAESYIYQVCEQELNGVITENQIFGIVKMKYPWMDDDIIWRLKGIGMFYARK